MQRWKWLCVLKSVLSQLCLCPDFLTLLLICPFLSNGLGLSSEGGFTFFPCFSMESTSKFIFYLFFNLSQTLTSLLFLSDLFKCCCRLLCTWNTFVHNINVSFGGLCKHCIEVFPTLIVVFRKSSLSTMLLIHKTT